MIETRGSSNTTVPDKLFELIYFYPLRVLTLGMERWKVKRLNTRTVRASQLLLVSKWKIADCETPHTARFALNFENESTN